MAVLIHHYCLEQMGLALLHLYRDDVEPPTRLDKRYRHELVRSYVRRLC